MWGLSAARSSNSVISGVEGVVGRHGSGNERLSSGGQIEVLCSINIVINLRGKVYLVCIELRHSPSEVELPGIRL